MTRVRHGRAACAALAALIIAMSAGCHAPRRVRGPVHAVWVTRFDYQTRDDVARVLENCHQAGFNTVMFQVRGNGTVFYPSRIEPWAEQFDFTDPGFDPLAVALTEAHQRGMQLHAWVNVMPAWRGSSPPPIANQLYHTRPEWFWYDSSGQRQGLHHQAPNHARDWYVSLNPCLPEVRRYLVDVFRELLSRYEIDGLHLDYIRFPNEAVVPGEKIPDYPRDRRTLALFHKDTGATPESDRTAWNKWRCDQVTRLVREIRRMAQATRPSACLSAAVGVSPKSALAHFQDSRRWVAEGLVDAVFPMNYTPRVDLFVKRSRLWIAQRRHPQVAIVCGLSVARSQNLTPAQSASIARQQIEAALEITGNFSLFAYSLLFDTGNEEPSRHGPEESAARAALRHALLPFLRSLSRRRNSA